MPLLLLCGIPGAGKTTLAKQLYKHFGVKHFSFDEFVEAQLKPSTSRQLHYIDPIEDDPDLLKPMKVYRKLWEHLIETYLNQLLESNDTSNPLIILDDNFYLQSQRRDFIKLGKRYGLKTCCVKVVVEVEEAQRRNERRCNTNGETVEALLIDENVIRKMDEKFEDSGIDYFYDSTISAIADLFTFIQTFQKTYPDKFSLPTSNAMLPSPSSVEHSALQELDSLSRKIASNIISSGYQRYGKVINDIRREFMEQIKANELSIKLIMDTVDCEENKTVIENFLINKIKACELEE